jgi:hypothetical protein
MSRNIPYQVESAQALLKTVGTIGAIFNRNAACTTNNASLNSALLCQTILPNTAGIFVETFRSDPKDYPNIINVDHHQITLTDSGALITNLQFTGPGHLCPNLPSSVNLLTVSQI